MKKTETANTISIRYTEKEADKISDLEYTLRHQIPGIIVEIWDDIPEDMRLIAYPEDKAQKAEIKAIYKAFKEV